MKKNTDRIQLGHGSGGKLMQNLINELIIKNFSNPVLNRLDDSAVINIKGTRIAVTTDSFVVTPIFFKGGDIGKLSICGTVNDLCMVGARPLYISAAFIIEEGLPITDLEKIIISMKNTAKECNVEIIAGDTKVVNSGAADKIFINTTGLGVVDNNINISAACAKIGDKIIINGTIGNHGVAILSQREGLNFKANIKSDCAALNSLVHSVLKQTRNIHVMRDPTRGGIASVLNEIAIASGVGIEIDEHAIPLDAGVSGAMELLGLDPLYVANEGKVIMVVAEDEADYVLKILKKHPQGKKTAIIGTVVRHHPKTVLLKTRISGFRILDLLQGEQLPRIC